MEFKDIIAVSGMSGLHCVLNKRPDGLIVKQLGEDKSRFVSNRIHTFSPLDKISIYTDDNDSVELDAVLRAMDADEEGGNSIPKGKKAPSKDLRAYMRRILPNFDEDKVYVSDIKKLIKWYELLKEFNLIPSEAVEEEEGDEVTEDTQSEEEEIEMVTEPTEASQTDAGEETK